MSDIAKSLQFEKPEDLDNKFLEEDGMNLNQGVKVVQSVWRQRATVHENCLSRLVVEKVPLVNLRGN